LGRRDAADIVPADLDTVLAALHDRGYGSITRTEGYDEASGQVPLPPEYREERPDDWRRFLPRIYCGDDPDLVPEALRETVESHGWTVQPMGRSAETVTVVVSENGV
jgi:hypothetical protein